MKKQPKCKHCGHQEFLVEYTETAHALVADTGEVLEDGINLKHHAFNWGHAWCKACNEPVSWVGPVS